MAVEVVRGRLVLPDSVTPGRVIVEDGWITAVETDDAEAGGPYIAPGFIDIHVHGWGGHDATGDGDALSGMARALIRQGVTTFLPTAVSLAEPAIPSFADRVRRWMPAAPADGAEPLGFNLEGPFLAPSRRGAHDPRVLRTPEGFDRAILDDAAVGLRVVTIAPELPGALELIQRLAAEGVIVSIGHSAATLDQALAGYRAGARSTTHLFNAMTGVDHKAPGVAVAALTQNDVYAELIADGNHVHPSLWLMITRLKGPDHLLLVSDALPLAGMGDGFGSIGGLPVEVHSGRATLVGTDTLAGSVIALDTAVRKLANSGVPLPEAVRAASTNPAALLGERDRGSIEAGKRAHLVELTDDLQVSRVSRGAGWIEAKAIPR